MANVQHKNCVIVGLGQTGLSCAQFLCGKGAAVAVMDTRKLPPALHTLQQDHPEVLVHTGSLSVEWLQHADQIILSPGVDPRLPELQAAASAGIEMIGDIELFARYADAPVIAITGSNGKSTVTTLISLMAKFAGHKVATGGNIGTPALDLLDETPVDFYVLELSSFQLETVNSLNAFAAVVLNISPDHLDRYNSVGDYQQAKQRIYQGNGVMVINRDDPIVAAMADPNRQTIGFGLKQHDEQDFVVRLIDGQSWLCEGQYELMPVKDMKIAGQHNIANALAALTLGSVMGLPMHTMLSALREFKGLPHRCRLVRERRGVRWYNDSKATNVGATIAAIEGFADNGEMILILGGVGKGQDFAALTPVLKAHVYATILIGEAADEIAAIVPSTVITETVDSIKSAVNLAAHLAKEGMQILLSPACASFDMFLSYVDRGQQFEQAVRELQT
ncbi:MAG: UDP-N-acetylmuramoyl-L-alanine--D-glutamate ligase [Methylophaga sp.]|nr:UDP-N-acetylmuramoyl-L-alanine--D-glutamate ligase [Methylophaga sp.]